MNTEITDKAITNGWVLYDADCRFCRRFAHWAERSLTRRHFRLEPLQTPWVQQRLQIPKAQLLDEMRLLTADGRCLGGCDALLQIAEYFWWTWPVRQMARIKIVKAGLEAAYRWVASHRGCASGRCSTHLYPQATAIRIGDWGPLILLVVAALFVRRYMAPWQQMWAMALAQYAGFKWISFRAARDTATSPSPLPTRSRLWGYFFLWPGMNAATFLDARRRPARTNWNQWAWPIAKTIMGVILFWFVARLVIRDEPLIGGWIAMIAMILMLHFGVFDLLSFAWRRRGVCAEPIMLRPLAATCLTDFWGRRWNRAFSDLANHLAFRPIRRRTNPVIATLFTFGFSGLVHELVITVPSGGGYGLPTAYFLIQAVGVLIERSRVGRRWGLGGGVRGKAFVIVMTCGPLMLLFPPVFIHHVILPMLSSLYRI